MANKYDNLIIGGAVLAVAYFAIIKPVTDKLGLTQSDKEKREAAVIEEAQNNLGWNPQLYTNQSRYIKAGTRVTIKTETSINAMVSTLNSAWGSFNDDENKIYSVFRQLASQLQLSQLCHAYSQKYKQDLLRRLQTPWNYFKGGGDGLSDKEFAIIAGIVKKLPLYT